MIDHADIGLVLLRFLNLVFAFDLSSLIFSPEHMLKLFNSFSTFSIDFKFVSIIVRSSASISLIVLLPIWIPILSFSCHIFNCHCWKCLDYTSYHTGIVNITKLNHMLQFTASLKHHNLIYFECSVAKHLVSCQKLRWYNK